MNAGEGTRNRNGFERTIEALATGLGKSISWLAEHGVLFAGFALIWAGVGGGLLLSEATVTQAWIVIGSQNVVLQALLWLLFLPVMAGVWIWHTDWPVLARSVVVIGLAGWNLLIFIPRRAAEPAAASGDDGATARG